MTRLDVGDNLGPAVCEAGFVTGEVEDTEEGDRGDSGSLAGAGNRIPTTDPVKKRKVSTYTSPHHFFLLVLAFDAVPEVASLLKDDNVMRCFNIFSVLNKKNINC